MFIVIVIDNGSLHYFNKPLEYKWMVGEPLTPSMR